MIRRIYYNMWGNLLVTILLLTLQLTYSLIGCGIDFGEMSMSMRRGLRNKRMKGTEGGMNGKDDCIVLLRRFLFCSSYKLTLLITL